MTARETSDPRDAFEDLYLATRADLLRYLIRRCPDAEEAADLLAETYLTAWRKLDAIPAGEAAQLWLYGVARNLLLRSARRRRVAVALIERLAGEFQAAQPTPAADQPQHEALRLALAELSEQDREILTLNAWEGLAPREIAQVVGANANIVRIRLHRARSRVRKQLGHPHEAIPSPRTQTASHTSSLPASSMKSSA
jgi:RNA polymerase sigma-70 factor, ECF subfamily